MPLYAFEYDSDGTIIKDDATGILAHTVLPTAGEMSDADFCAPDELSKTLGLRHQWLHAVFKQDMPDNAESDTLNEFKLELSHFLSTKTKGPYYVHDDAVDARSSISIVFLTAADIEAFKEAYPDWVQDKDRIKENAETLSKWREYGRALEDPGLYRYASVRLN